MPDLAIVTQSDQDTRCEDQDTYVIELITSQIGDYLITNSGNSSEYVCYPKDKVFNFKDFLEDANQDGIIDWVSNKLVEDKYDIDLLLELDANQSWLINTSWRGSLGPLIGKENILKDITSQIIASNNPTELRDEIIFYRNRWGTNDETGQNIRGLLDYLLALTYELEGNEKQAKDIFYRIWRNQANTFWAHLAASRLEYIP